VDNGNAQKAAFKPGGSVRDAKVIAAADVFAGMRHCIEGAPITPATR
jgi:AICAR transformylase/IMP cyclohydrolase PurH